MELFLLLALATGGTLLALNAGSDEGETAEPDSSPDPDEQPDPDGQSDLLTGTVGQDDVLTGGVLDDVLTGNAGDFDRLSGGGGEDELHLGAGNLASGGAGSDMFFLNGPGSPDTVIEDFDLATDRLGLTDSYDDLELYLTEDGAGVRFVEPQGQATVLTLQNLSLADDETLEVGLYDDNGDLSGTMSFSGPVGAAPFVTDAIRGTSGDDVLTGTGGNDVIFGEGGADTLTGGEGDDSLFSGSGTVFYPDSYNHYPGDLTKVGEDGDVLDGGAGDDDLWIGPGTTATGGAGADTFHAFTNVFDAGAEPAEITDFDPAEDQLLIDFPITPASGATPAFLFDDAIAGLTLTYDSDADHTLLAMDGVAITTLNGDQSAASVAFHDNYSTDEDRWRDGAGAVITADQGQAASIILEARELFSVVGL